MGIDNQNNRPESMMAFLKKIAATVSNEEKEPKEQLQVEIGEISESGYCAGWARDVEFYLWKIILDGSETEFGVKTISKQEIANLRSLSEQSGGWWHWSKEENKAVFVTLNEWQEFHQQFLEKQSK